MYDETEGVSEGVSKMIGVQSDTVKGTEHEMNLMLYLFFDTTGLFEVRGYCCPQHMY